MPYRRFPVRDPRTVAREIPGISDLIFPQLTPGLVAQLNKRARSCAGVEAVPYEMVNASSLMHSMLFEVAVVRGQQILMGRTEVDWDDCLRIATNRQRRHFDAQLPDSLGEVDMAVADWVGRNLAQMLDQVLAVSPGCELVHSPRIVGYQWISSSEGDFALGEQLVEVKCTNKNFGSADFRQVLMYWLLSYAASIERGSKEWKKCILLNPRLNHMVEMPFDEAIGLSADGRSKVEILEMFAFVVGEYGLKALSDFDL